MNSKLSLWLELGKVKITMAVSITTIAGYLLFTTILSPDLLLTVLGIFLLASGASALNHIQEFNTSNVIRLLVISKTNIIIRITKVD